MSFASLIWLIGLVPWLGLAVWLLTGHHQRADVPFVHLWRGIQPAPRSSRSLRMPPAAVVLMLMSVLLAILAAAGPRVHGLGKYQPVTIIVDRGPTTDVQQNEMRVEAAEWLRAASCRAEDLILVPDGQPQSLQGADWTKLASNTPLTSFDTTDLLKSAVELALKRNTWPVLVLSDRPLRSGDERIVRIGSKSPVENVGIVSVAAREHPRPQVMVRIRNQSALSAAEVFTTSGGQVVSKAVKLHVEPPEQTVCLDLLEMGEVVRIGISAPGDRFAGDNLAWLVKQRGWPVLETRSAVPRALERMISVYRGLRPAGEGSTCVSITTDPANIIIARPAVLLAPEESMRTYSDLNSSNLNLMVEDHPITAQIDWKRAVSGARIATVTAETWRPIVRVDDRVLVAVREDPRQVWVGFESEQWSRSPEFVMFWTNVFGWVGEGTDGVTNEPMRQLSEEWQRADDLSGGSRLELEPPPGVYRMGDGAVRALNCLDLQIPAPSQIDWKSAPSRRIASQPVGTRLDAASLVAALGCALLASLLWAGGTRHAGST